VPLADYRRREDATIAVIQFFRHMILPHEIGPVVEVDNLLE
jgi:hypothetical protein